MYKTKTYATLSRYIPDNADYKLPNLWISLNFVMDESVETTVRTSYNLIDVLTNSGGFASIIMLVFTILTRKVQKILYFLSMLRKFYLCLDESKKDALRMMDDKEFRELISKYKKDSHAMGISTKDLIASIKKHKKESMPLGS